jgi:hypothetical protein
MNILKPKVKAVEIPAQAQPQINFDDILDLLAKPSPIQVSFSKSTKDFNPAFETVQVQDIPNVIKNYTLQGSQHLLDNQLKEGIEALRYKSILSFTF